MSGPVGGGSSWASEKEVAEMISMTKRLSAVAVLLCALAIPATAPAAVHKLKGTFHAEGVPGTGKVSIEVVVKKGKPVRIRNLTFKNLPARCNVSEVPLQPVYEPAGTLSGGAGKNSNGDGIEFGRALQWISYPNNGARQVLMNGKLSKSGKRITKGKLEVHNNASGACQSAVGTFTATK
jgi:hypothetical protein